MGGQRMTDTRFLRALGWGVFAALLVAIGIVFLAACDLNIRPLFGLRYCVSHAHAPDLRAQREHERELQNRVHEAELRLAQLPVCTPSPKPQPKDKDVPSPSPKEKEAELKVPSRLEDLRGCWQSLRGDIEIVSDDAEAKPMGKVRMCYCFGTNGRGKAKWQFTDGRSCETGLTATLKDNELDMAHGSANCTDHSTMVPAEITCKGQADGDTNCDTQSLGQTRRRAVDEKYQRVSDEHCASAR
jgi:hypothetical protein